VSTHSVVVGGAAVEVVDGGAVVESSQPSSVTQSMELAQHVHQVQSPTGQVAPSSLSLPSSSMHGHFAGSTHVSLSFHT
jgi:hypothetical protein